MARIELAHLMLCSVVFASGCFALNPKEREPHRTKEQMVIHDLASALAGKEYTKEEETQYDLNALCDYLGRIIEMCFHGTRSEMRNIMAQPDGYFKDYPFVFEILKDRKAAELEWKDIDMILPTDNNILQMRILKHFENGGKTARQIKQTLEDIDTAAPNPKR